MVDTISALLRTSEQAHRTLTTNPDPCNNASPVGQVATQTLPENVHGRPATRADFA